MLLYALPVPCSLSLIATLPSTPPTVPCQSNHPSHSVQFPLLVMLSYALSVLLPALLPSTLPTALLPSLAKLSHAVQSLLSLSPTYLSRNTSHSSPTVSEPPLSLVRSLLPLHTTVPAITFQTKKD